MVQTVPVVGYYAIKEKYKDYVWGLHASDDQTSFREVIYQHFKLLVQGTIRGIETLF